MLITKSFFHWKNVLIIFLVAVVAHHFVKGWTGNAGPAAGADQG